MSILKSILHRYNTTNQNYDTLHPETEHAQVTDFGNGVLAHLLDSTLVSAVTAVSTGSLFGKLVEKLLEASGVQYNFQNSNAWYICLGDLFGGLIIQGGTFRAVPNVDDWREITLPISYSWNYASLVCAGQRTAHKANYLHTLSAIKYYFYVSGTYSANEPVSFLAVGK